MQSAQRMFFVGMLLVALAVAAPAAAQQPGAEPDAPQAQMPVYGAADGELTKVDADARTLVIETADGAEITFAYDDGTEVEGANEEVAGLATDEGTSVTVHYTQEGEVRTATKVEVKTKDE